MKLESKEKKNLYLWTGLFFFIFFIFSISFFSFSKPYKKELNIVTTIFPLQEFAQEICGKRGEVFLLLPPGAEVHSWKPRPSDILKISEADLLIMVGADLEPWVEDIIQSLAKPDLRIIRVSIELPEHFLIEKENSVRHIHNGLDPHFWLDFDLDQKLVEKIKNILMELDPEGADIYSANAAQYLNKLALLDKSYKEGLINCTNRTLVVAGHAAFGYLARRYKLEQIALSGISPDSRPTPRDMVRLVNLVKEKGVKAIFFEQAFTDEVARVIAGETGVKIFVLNPGANISKKHLKEGITFIDIMYKNLENLRYGLGCS